MAEGGGQAVFLTGGSVESGPGCDSGGCPDSAALSRCLLCEGVVVGGLGERLG